jgi:hypothetical protein
MNEQTKSESVEKIVKTYSWDTTPSTRVVNWGDVADHHNESLTQAVEEAYKKGHDDGYEQGHDNGELDAQLYD